MRITERTPLTNALGIISLVALIAMGFLSALSAYDPSPYWGAFLLIVYLVSLGYGAIVQAFIEAKYD